MDPDMLKLKLSGKIFQAHSVGSGRAGHNYKLKSRLLWLCISLVKIEQ